MSEEAASEQNPPETANTNDEDATANPTDTLTAKEASKVASESPNDAGENEAGATGYRASGKLGGATPDQSAIATEGDTQGGTAGDADGLHEEAADDDNDNDEQMEALYDARSMRRIIAEDPDYNLATVPTLEQSALKHIIDHFDFNASMYHELMPRHRQQLLENISLSVPLKVTAPLVPIDDTAYWPRKCRALWRNCDVSQYGGSWKRMFFERRLEQIVENFVPRRTDQTQLDEIAQLCRDHVRALHIRQLLPPVKAKRTAAAAASRAALRNQQQRAADGGVGGGAAGGAGGGAAGAGDDEEDEDEEDDEAGGPGGGGAASDHFQFGALLAQLPHLTELRLTYGVRRIGMNFDWAAFQFTVNDCVALARTLRDTTQLRVFALTRSRVDCDRCRVLISHLLDHPGLTELDLSENRIGDRGARALGKLANNRCPRLVSMRLCANKIGPEGAQAIAYALTKNTTLQHLDLRLNRLGDDGGQAICRALLKHAATNEAAGGVGGDGGSALENLNLAANQMTEPTAASLSQVLSMSAGARLQMLDLSNNRLGPDGGKQLQEGISANRTLLWIDLRFTDCGQEAEFAIGRIVERNRERFRAQHEETDSMIKSHLILRDAAETVVAS